MSQFEGVIPGDLIEIIQGFGAVWAGEECLVHIVNPMWVHVKRLSNGVRFQMEPWRLGRTFRVIERPEKCSECGGEPHPDRTCGYEPPGPQEYWMSREAVRRLDPVDREPILAMMVRIAELEAENKADGEQMVAYLERIDALEELNTTLQERNFRYLAALTDIGEQDENALVYLPTAHLKGQRARKAIH
jgi:hypothetical protein